MKKIKTALLGLTAGLANGLFGSGGGTIIVPGLREVMGVEQHKSHATAIAVILPLTIISSFVYLSTVKIDWSMAIWVSVGGAVGGFIGAKVLNKVSGKWLHKIFGAVMIAAAIRMLI